MTARLVGSMVCCGTLLLSLLYFKTGADNGAANARVL